MKSIWKDLSSGVVRNGTLVDLELTVGVIIDNLHNIVVSVVLVDAGKGI